MPANPGVRKDPYLAFCFKVTVDIPGIGEANGFFKSVGGLESETEVVPYREGGVNDTTHQLVGAVKWKNIVLKRGFCGPELAQWRQAWANGPGPRTTGTIQQLAADGSTVVATWTFKEGWPSKWSLSELDASKSEISIETLEIVHEGLKFG
ncbi:MAG TPA: phage tail protein [Kofleriaceae bacterium]|nr:phage tail protein [Kofleriaceae bacterium]